MSPELRFCGCHTHAKQRSFWRVKTKTELCLASDLCFCGCHKHVCGFHRNCLWQPQKRKSAGRQGSDARHDSVLRSKEPCFACQIALGALLRVSVVAQDTHDRALFGMPNRPVSPVLRVKDPGVLVWRVCAFSVLRVCGCPILRLCGFPILLVCGCPILCVCGCPILRVSCCPMWRVGGFLLCVSVVAVFYVCVFAKEPCL